MKSNWFLRHRTTSFLIIAVVPAVVAYIAVDARCASIWFFIFAILIAVSVFKQGQGR